MKLEVPESFEDVAVYFSREEWKMLSNEEKQLHKEVMIQNYDHMVSIGFIIPMEQLLQLIEKSDELPSNIMKEDVTKVQGDRHEITPTNFFNVRIMMATSRRLRNVHAPNWTDEEMTQMLIVYTGLEQRVRARSKNFALIDMWNWITKEH
ncbi:zinc finger protein 19-like isoform X3 [Protopterus annectens]|uniref:zinc finger protein 19-like isoform X3 n=1 Tax=Protopterus annectens TaxID=7888 RepID=UPI001CFB9D3E|nr:zinc finger protein 19-like isoform X3 [Protopterus annectens]